MKKDMTHRFGFLVNDVARLHGQQFDRLARERIGLSRAQCRVLGALAMQGDEEPLSQTQLARRLDLSAMAVGGLCDRLEAAGWIRREPCPSDRRANRIRLAPRATEALDAALAIGDVLQARVLEALSAAERAQLLLLLGKAREGLLALAAAEAEAVG